MLHPVVWDRCLAACSYTFVLMFEKFNDLFAARCIRDALTALRTHSLFLYSNWIHSSSSRLLGSRVMENKASKVLVRINWIAKTFLLCQIQQGQSMKNPTTYNRGYDQMLSTPLTPTYTLTLPLPSKAKPPPSSLMVVVAQTLKQVWNGVFRYNVAARGWVWLAVLRSLCFVMSCFWCFRASCRRRASLLHPASGVVALFWFYWGNDDFGRENCYPVQREREGIGKTEDCATIKWGEVNVGLVQGFWLNWAMLSLRCLVKYVVGGRVKPKLKNSYLNRKQKIYFIA